MVLEVTFDAELWQWEGDGGWHFVTLPGDVAAEVRDRVPVRRGFGSVRVTATVGTSTWQTSVFPDTKTGSFVLPVKAPVRRANDIVAGDRIKVAIVVDSQPA